MAWNLLSPRVNVSAFSAYFKAKYDIAYENLTQMRKRFSDSAATYGDL